MRNSHLRAAQVNHVDNGTIKIQVTSSVGLIPVQDARITISYTGEAGSALEQVTTNAEGQSETLTLAAPPLEYSMEPEQMNQPYAEYTVQVEAEGYRPVSIEGVDVFSGELSLQNVRMEPLEVSEEGKNIVIPANTLFGNFPPKIAEAEIKPIDESGEIVLSRVVVPEYVIVHDGTPGDSTAGDYYVRYKDYIKNVASSEIYATWPDSTIRANILAIMSFTMNRVYTEWYRDIQKFWVKLQSWNM